MIKKSKDRFKIYKNVFDEFTLLTLFKLSSQNYFDELVNPIRMGKEANIFLASTKGREYVIVKIYRLASCNFNQMYHYIKSDPRFMGLGNRRRLVILKWVQREYRNLSLAHTKIDAPKPIAFYNNVIVMESIGGPNPASQLKDEHPKKPEEFADKILQYIKIMVEDLSLVHGDLSEFNILNHNDKPCFIDFSQATNIRDPEFMGYLRRDLGNIARFFLKLKVKIDIEKAINSIQFK